MDVKLKYRSWVKQKHADLSSSLINSDIEKFAVEFAEWLNEPSCRSCKFLPKEYNKYCDTCKNLYKYQRDVTKE